MNARRRSPDYSPDCGGVDIGTVIIIVLLFLLVLVVAGKL